MRNDHPSVEDLENFLGAKSGPGSTTRNARVLRHLLAECSECRNQLALLGWGGDRLERLVSMSSDTYSDNETVRARPSAAVSYDAAFAKAERAVDAFLSEPPPIEASSGQLLEELESLSQQQAASALSAERYAHPELVQRLVERSNSLRFSDPSKMLWSAKLGLDLALRCTPERCGSLARLKDCQGLAWIQYATALRVGSQVRESEEAGERSLLCLNEGTGDPVLRLTVYRHIATIHQFHRRFDQAIEFLREAGSIARQIGDSHALATTLVQEAIATLYAGEAEAAVRLINQAIPLIDQEVDPYLLLAACHNLVRCFIDLDRPEQALAIYSEIRDLYKDLREDMISLRASWQEGQLLRDLGHPVAAETALLRARDGFLQRGVMFDSALVSLDLTALYIRMGRTTDVRQTVEATVPVFRALGIEREELAALLQLQQVAEQQQKALDLVRFLNSRIQPGARDEVLK